MTAEYIERWRAVPGYFGRYEVSDLGRVQSFVLPGGHKRLRREPLLIQGDRQRYVSVVLSQEDGSVRRKYVHQLVLEAFVGPAPKGQEGAHEDGDKQNNRLGNLAWKTHPANEIDKRKHGTNNAGERHPMSKLTEVQAHEIRAASGLQKDIAARYSVTATLVSQIKARKIWNHV